MKEVIKMALIVLVVLILLFFSIMWLMRPYEKTASLEELKKAKLELREEIRKSREEASHKFDTLNMNVDSLKSGQAIIYLKLDKARKPLFSLSFTN